MNLNDTTTQDGADEEFDISAMAAADTFTFPLENADGDPLLNPKNQKEITVTVFGPGTKQYQRATGARNRAVLEHVRKGGKKMKDEDQRRIDAEFLAACTASMNNFGYKKMPGGYDMHVAVYMDTKIGFIAEQVNKKVGDWANFMQASGKA